MECVNFRSLFAPIKSIGHDARPQNNWDSYKFLYNSVRLRAINLFSCWCPVSWCSGTLALASLLNFSHLIFDRFSINCWKPFLHFRRFCLVCHRLTEPTTKRSPIWLKWKCSEIAIFLNFFMEPSHVYLVKFQVNMFLHSKRMLLSFVFSQTFLIKFSCLLRVNCVVFINALNVSCLRPISGASFHLCSKTARHNLVANGWGLLNRQRNGLNWNKSEGRNSPFSSLMRVRFFSFKKPKNTCRLINMEETFRSN